MSDWKYEPARDQGLAPKERLRSHRRESGLVGATAQGAAWALNRLYMRLAHRPRITGIDRLPETQSFIVAANHCGHLDIMTVCAALPWQLRERVFPIAAGDVFFQTPTSTLFSALALNALPMWRRSCGRHGMDELRQRLLDLPTVYVLFPEGTRSRTGEMAPFKPGVGMLVAGTDVPIVPCRLRGTFEAWPPARRLPRPRKVSVSFGEPQMYTESSNDKKAWRAIAASLEKAVSEL